MGDNPGANFVFEHSEEIPARRTIRVDGGDLGTATKAAITALTTEPNPLSAIYVKGPRLVFPTRLRSNLSEGGIKRPDNALAVRLADRDVVALRLTRVATFHKSTKKGPPREVDPPERICNTVLAAIPWTGIPTLAGIVETPTVLPSGRLISAPGYDRNSGLLFDPGSTRFPEIPAQPTRDEAEAALKLLGEPLEGFPFVSSADRSVALSAILTALVRRGLRAAPLICFSAPKPASGKTLLANLPAYIATGRVPYIMPPVDDPNEERKRLLAALSECPSVILIDNIERAFRSSSMCITLSEPTFTDRVLGSTENRTAETNCTFLATGNNLVLAGDLSSRALKCEIDPACEKPDERLFTLNLHEWAPSRRGELATAALTIIKGYLEAGSPDQNLPNFARFEEWQQLCRFPLTWLGCEDPCKTRAKVAGADPVQMQLGVLLAAWRECFADARVSLKHAIKQTENAKEGTPQEALREAMEAIAADRGGSINMRSLGRFIARFERRIEGGLCLQRDGVSHQAILWRVLKAGELTSYGEFLYYPAGEKHGDFHPNRNQTNSPKLVNSPPDAPDGWPNGEDAADPEDAPFPPGSVEVEL